MNKFCFAVRTNWTFYIFSVGPPVFPAASRRCSEAPAAAPSVLFPSRAFGAQLLITTGAPALIFRLFCGTWERAGARSDAPRGANWDAERFFFRVNIYDNWLLPGLESSAGVKNECCSLKSTGYVHTLFVYSRFSVEQMGASAPCISSS